MKLKRSFFERDAQVVAEEILGSFMILKDPKQNWRLRITEAEAYLGPHDLACHTARGKTPRTEIMFGRGGFAYVYLIYGIYSMFNIVTGGVGDGQAVLIRGAEVIDGPKCDLSGPGGRLAF